jgi:hypothetical protein
VDLSNPYAVPPPPPPPRDSFPAKEYQGKEYTGFAFLSPSIVPDVSAA